METGEQSHDRLRGEARATRVAAGEGAAVRGKPNTTREGTAHTESRTQHEFGTVHSEPQCTPVMEIQSVKLK